MSTFQIFQIFSRILKHMEIASIVIKPHVLTMQTDEWNTFGDELNYCFERED